MTDILYLYILDKHIGMTNIINIKLNFMECCISLIMSIIQDWNIEVIFEIKISFVSDIYNDAWKSSSKYTTFLYSSLICLRIFSKWYTINLQLSTLSSNNKVWHTISTKIQDANTRNIFLRTLKHSGKLHTKNTVPAKIGLSNKPDESGYTS